MTTRSQTVVEATSATATVSITLGDSAENHVGMQMIGKRAKAGFSSAELRQLSCDGKEVYELSTLLSDCDDQKGVPEQADITEAVVVVLRHGVQLLLGGEDGKAALAREIAATNASQIDKKALMRGRVVNKRARWNNCYGDASQLPDVAKGKGTVVAFDSVPEMARLRAALPRLFGPKAKDLVAETNLYYDVSKCGIGFHGDTERRIVVCARFGASMPLVFQWFYKNEPVGKQLRLTLNDGDVYVMSQKAVGHDWKRSSIYTLRHAAGCAQYLVARPSKGVAKKRKLKQTDQAE
jgi:hypothetical protein